MKEKNLIETAKMQGNMLVRGVRAGACVRVRGDDACLSLSSGSRLAPHPTDLWWSVPPDSVKSLWRVFNNDLFPPHRCPLAARLHEYFSAAGAALLLRWRRELLQGSDSILKVLLCFYSFYDVIFIFVLMDFCS